jgi:hypothetical protein
LLDFVSAEIHPEDFALMAEHAVISGLDQLIAGWKDQTLIHFQQKVNLP